MHITYKQLLEISSWGVFSKPMKGISCIEVDHLKSKKIKEAMHGGVYTGSPGKDIYLMLPYLSECQMQEIAKEVCSHFPKIPPSNHVNVAACIRFIYGQFAKQGILRSDDDFKRMQGEDLDWKLPREFIKIMYNILEKDSNYYGLSILCEMEGHRLGDEAVLKNSIESLKLMEETYNKSVKFACKCNSYKQTFTPYYWGSRYFMKFEDEENAIKYSKLTIENANKGGSGLKGGYVDKLSHCISYLKKHDKSGWKEFYKKYKENAKNKDVKKAINKVKK
jgi:hypothetical protein